MANRLPIWRRWLRAARGTDYHCESGVAEMVVIWPVAMVLVLVVVQAALWAHAAQVVQAAAADGDQAARAYGAPASAGIERADATLATLGQGVVSSPQVSQTTGPGGTVEVFVSARAESIVPGMGTRVSAKSTGTVQSYRPSG